MLQECIQILFYKIWRLTNLWKANEMLIKSVNKMASKFVRTYLISMCIESQSRIAIKVSFIE